MLSDIFNKRLAELEAAGAAIPLTSGSGGSTYARSGTWEGWATSAQDTIEKVFGPESAHAFRFKAEFDKCGGSDHSIKAMRGILTAARTDFAAGYVFNVELRVSGEVIGDFVAMAKTALPESKDVAAVLACAALEDTLKKFAAANSLEVSAKDMQQVINALKGKGLLSGPLKTLVDAMPKIRDHAMHANWDKITAPEVGSVIAFVEQLLLTKFSPP